MPSYKRCRDCDSSSRRSQPIGIVAQSGDLIHLDIKKLGRFERVGHRITGSKAGIYRPRGAGWEFAHVCIDDASRVAYVELLPNEKGDTTTAFLERALSWLDHGIHIARHDRQRRSKAVSSRRAAGATSSGTSSPALTLRNKWQSRALHPDPATGVGLCSALFQLRRQS